MSHPKPRKMNIDYINILRVAKADAENLLVQANQAKKIGDVVKQADLFKQYQTAQSRYNWAKERHQAQIEQQYK